MINEILDKIIEYDKITIFRHQRPDGDAMFSAYALYLFLKDNFKNKTIKVAGFDKFDLVNKADKISDNFIKESLAIVLDTATVNRIDDERFSQASYIIKIDHHPPLDRYGDLNYEVTCGATAEIVGDMLLSNCFKGHKISKKVCEYLYCGILTDTLNFKTNSTTPNTLAIASKLAEYGNLNVSKLSSLCFEKSLDDFYFETLLRNKLVVKDKFGYILLKQRDLNALNCTSDKAKLFVECIGAIKDLNIWGIIAYNKETKGYDASLRSKSGYTINTLAEKYGGGGHKCAVGLKSLNIQLVEEIIEKLAYISKK